MSDLIAILNQSANGLAAFRAAAQTAGHNLQNVNTPGYSRQTVDLAAMPAQFLKTGAFIGQGVNMIGISQSRDAFVERQMPGALASEAQSTAENDTLQSVSALNPDAAGGLTSSLSTFYSNLRALAQNPSDMGLRSTVLASAQTLATSFNATGSAIESARTGVDATLAANVSDANNQATTIASLNAAIAQARAQGAEPNDLLDQRQLASDKLSQLTGATPVIDKDGNVNMLLPGGAALVSGTNAAQLSTAVDATNGGHLTIQITRIGSSAPDSLSPTSGFGGTLRGLLDARDGTLKTSIDGLDQMAFDLGSALNTQNQAGVALDGSAGQAIFQLPSTAAGASQSIAVNAALVGNPQLIATSSTAAGLPGDATNAYALVNTESTTLTGGKDAADTYANIITQFGSSVQAAAAVASQDKAISTQLSNMRESTSGVSIDEEVVNMTQAQRAFEAVSKVITTTNSMLDTLMSLTSP